MIITEKMMKEANNLKYSKKQRNELNNAIISGMGKQLIMIMAMEEIAELIDVCLNDVMGELDYVHVAEEIFDVYRVSELIKMIYGVKNNELDTDNPEYYDDSDNSNIMLQQISVLAKCQSRISKILRYPEMDNLHEVVTNMLENLISTVGVIRSECKVTKADIKRIEMLKYRRTERRLNGEEDG